MNPVYEALLFSPPNSMLNMLLLPIGHYTRLLSIDPSEMQKSEHVPNLPPTNYSSCTHRTRVVSNPSPPRTFTISCRAHHQLPYRRNSPRTTAPFQRMIPNPTGSRTTLQFIAPLWPAAFPASKPINSPAQGPQLGAGRDNSHGPPDACW